MSDDFEAIVAESVKDRARSQGWAGLTALAQDFAMLVETAMEHTPTSAQGRAAYKLAYDWADAEHERVRGWEAAWDTGAIGLTNALTDHASAAKDAYEEFMSTVATTISDHDFDAAERWVEVAECDALRANFLAYAYIGEHVK